MATDKMSADRLRSAAQVLAAVRTHGPALEAQLRAQFAVADLAITPILTAIATSIEAAAGGLEAANAAHQAELDDDHAPRAERDARAAAVYEAIVQLRQAVGGMYGPAAVKALGQTGTLTQRPDRLVTTAKGLLEQVPRVLPEQAPRFVHIDPEQLVAPLREPTEALATALMAVERERREAEATLIARDAAMDAHDAAFGRGAAALAGLFRLAGMDAHAARVRPSRRRPGQVEALVDDVTAPIVEDEADAEG